MNPVIVAFIGVFLGIVSRTAFPYLRKVAAGEKLEWCHDYTAAALATLVLCIIVTALVFPGLLVPETGILWPLLTGYVFGFGFDALVIEAGKWAAE